VRFGFSKSFYTEKAMTCFQRALLKFEQLATHSTPVDPAEISLALGQLYDACDDTAGRQLIDEIGTCCEHLLTIWPADGWRASYEMEVWSDHLLDLCDQLGGNL
jgi:hypothetical protein